MKRKHDLKLIFALSLTIAGCGSNSHIAPIPEVHLPQTRPNLNPHPNETRAASRAARHAIDDGLNPIYLVIESNKMLSNQSASTSVPETFRIMTMSVAQEFSPAAVIYTANKTFVNEVLKQPTKSSFGFELEGAITVFDDSSSVISSGVDFGIDFGGGKTETSHASDYRNTDKVTYMEIDIFLKQQGKIYSKSTGSIDITNSNRGYNFGLQINNSGFGINAYNTKRQGIGKSIRKLLYGMLNELISDAIYRTNNRAIAKSPSSVPKTQLRYSLPPSSTKNTTPKREYSAPSYPGSTPSYPRDSTQNYPSISKEEKDFINSL